MYLHVGENLSVKKDDVVGIFDIDTSTMKKSTEKFLLEAQQNNRLKVLSEEIPRSIVVVKNKNKTEVYLSIIASKTLQSRWDVPF